MEPLIALVLATVVSMALIPAMWRLAPHLGLIDRPDPRKVHSTEIPRVGGWGIVIGTLFPLIVLLPMEPLVESYLLGCVVLFSFGVWDDAKEIGHYKKFAGQLLAVLLVVVHGGLRIDRVPLWGDALPPAAGMALTCFAMVGMINAINHSDGLDGLAGGESVLSLIVIAFLAHTAGGLGAVVIAAALSGGILGFLRYNTHPARVFMGDSGSQVLGYSLGFLAILLTQEVHTALSPAITLFFLGLPIIDIIAVLIQRVRKRRNWFLATRNHIHHRLLDLGFHHHETVIIIYLIQACFVISAVLLRYQDDVLIVALYLLACALIFGLLVAAERSGWRRTATAGRLLPELPGTALKLEVFKHYPCYAIAWAVPLYLLVLCVGVSDVPGDFTIASAVFGTALLTHLLWGRPPMSLMVRGAIYVAVVFGVFLAWRDPVMGSSRVAEGVFFAGLLVAIALTLRWASELHFRTTPMDYLVLAGVTTAAVLGQDPLALNGVSLLIVKAVVLLYASELVIERATARWNMLNLAALLTLGTFAVKGLLA